MGDLDFFNLSSSLKVKCDAAAVGLPICDFYVVFISTTWPNSAPLLDISLQHLSDLDTDL